jgi:UDP-GlcNAc:undecaprenyl-phosphate GlcNAc-1-phosphate transferase
VALPAVLISSSISLVLVPIIIRVAHRNGWYDSTNDRKIHKGQIPRLGGIAIFLGFALGVAVVVAFGGLTRGGTAPVANLILCAAGVALVFAIGLIDDFHNIPAVWKAFGQVVAALAVVAAGCVIRQVSIPFLGRTVALGAAGYPITVLWIVGMSNAVNLIDGMDGMAGGVSLIAAASFAVIGIIEGNPALTLFGLALVGGALGFLAFNFPSASIFMGDSGSLVLGFVLAMLPLMPFTTQSAGLSIIQPITILFIPILDTAAAIIRRLLRGEPIHAPDREHLHHKILDLGLSTRQALSVVYGAAIVLGGLGLAYEYLSSAVATMIFIGVCVVGAASMRILAIKHARMFERSHTEFLPDNVSYREPSFSAESERDSDADRAVR